MTGARWPGGLALALAVAVAGCSAAAGSDEFPTGGSGGGTDPTSLCAGSIAVDPAMPIAGPDTVLHARAVLSGGGDGPPAYAWHVRFDGVPIDGVPPQAGGAAIDIPAPRAGIYAIELDVPDCAMLTAVVNVEMAGALTQNLRIQVVPPRDAAVPPTELFAVLPGGADRDLGLIPVSQGRVFQVPVLGPAGGVPAYLRFSPSATPDAVVEAFADGSGTAAVQLVPGPPYSVLVVPSSDNLAPRRIQGWSTSQAVNVDAGVTVSGSVVRSGAPGSGSGDAPLAGATVRLVSDGVPSTPAVTAADGSFSLHVAPGLSVTVEVTPPDGGGLPRLSATSAGFDLGAPVEVRYAANLGLVDLAGAVVQRAAAPVPGAQVTVVGSLDTAGTVTAGATVVASGQVRIAATAGGSGALPRTLVPAGPLSAVIEIGPQDLAVAPLDVTGGAPAILDAPPMPLVTTAVTAMIDGQAARLPGALIDLVPAGALAMAAAPILRLTAGGDGALAAALPAGGHYQLRLHDPQGRGAPLVILDREVTAIASSYLLPAAIRIEGALLRDGNVALPGASVQLMCTGCSGFDAALPLTEVVSDAAGRFTLAVPDPGTR